MLIHWTIILRRLVVVLLVLFLVWPVFLSRTSVRDVSVVLHHNETFVIVEVNHYVSTVPQIIFYPVTYFNIRGFSWPSSFYREETVLYHLLNGTLKRYSYQNTSYTTALSDGKDLYFYGLASGMWNGSGIVTLTDPIAMDRLLPYVARGGHRFDPTTGWSEISVDQLNKFDSDKKTNFLSGGSKYCLDYDDEHINGKPASRLSLQGLKPATPKWTLFRSNFRYRRIPFSKFWMIVHS